MAIEILKISFLCIIMGSASIPISFTINDSPVVVWVGNAAGSLLSAFVVIFVGDRVMSSKFRMRINKSRFGKKIILSFDEGTENRNVIKASSFINKHGLRIFSLLCPIFPGVLISTVTVYLLNLDKRIYKKWMFSGVIFVSGAYVMGYWWVFVR